MEAIESPRRRGIGVLALLATAAAVYMVLLGGTEAGVIVSSIRIVNGAMAGLFIAWWVRRLPTASDPIDRLTLLALLGFLAAGLLGAYPRQTLDACLAAVAWVAAFYVARRLAAAQRSVDFALDILGAAGLILSLLVALLWGGTWLRWASLTSFHSWPPLTIDLPELVFHHVSVVAFTVLMLLPAVLRLWRWRSLRPAVVLGICAAGFVVIASGSRTAWVAAFFATLFTVGLRVIRRSPLPRPDRNWVVVGLTGAAGVLAVMFASGMGTPLVERLGTVGTIVSRSQTWSAAIALWLQDPWTGTGPGSFVAALPTTGYFRMTAFAPRHADNAAIQLLAEGGLVAAIPLAFAVGASTRRILTEGRSWSAVWAIGLFAFSSFTNNPTYSAGLNALLVMWLAVALPANSHSEAPRWPEAPRSRQKPLTRLSVLGLIAVGVAYTGISSAQIAYDVALSKARVNDLPGARSGFEIAAALDPGLALYQRELGLVALAQGDEREALRRLLRAVDELPTDDVNMRALAIADWRAGRLHEALDVARESAELRPASTANLLLAAALEDAAGTSAAGSSLLVEAIQIDPLLPASPFWAGMTESASPAGELIAHAARSAGTGPPPHPQLLYYAPTLLASAAGLPVSLPSISVPTAWNLLFQCRLAEAKATITAAQGVAGGSGDYWFTRAVIASAEGSDQQSLRLARLVSVEVRSLLAAPPGGSNPAFDQAQDRALYGRGSLAELPGFALFPTHADAVSAWLREPFMAADKAGPASALATCR